MHAAGLLDMWDAAHAAAPADRALLLAVGGGAAADVTDAGLLPVGERDLGLLAFRRRLFGRRMDLLATCPQCAQPLEFDLDSRDLEAAAIARDWPVDVTVGEHVLRCRPATTADLVAAFDGAVDLAAARRRLFARCVDCEAAPSDMLAEDAVIAVADELARHDPLADIRIALNCPTCATAWDAQLDPPGLLWSALDAWGGGQLLEVAELARRFGWSEQNILAMSPARRRFYLAALA